MPCNVVSYSRISQADQSHNSLSHQQQSIIEYCKRNNLNLVKTFVENGKSAFTFDRPEWKKLEAYIKANKKIFAIVVYHIDRFSRATLMDALIKLNEIEVKLNVKVLTVTDPVNMDSNDLGVQLMRTINLLFSNNERNRIQDRVKDGVYRSLANGRFCNMAPVGYKNSKDAEGKPLLVIDEEKAKYIKRIFRLYNEGMNIERIRINVPELKLKGNSAIQRILSNSIYAGIIELPAYKGKPAREVTALHKPIISRYEYYAAKNKINKKHITVQPSKEVWLRGMLYCNCGRLMTAGNSRSKTGKYYWYYKCNEHLINYRATALHEKFKEILSVLSFSNASIKFIREKLLRSIEEHQSKKGGNIMRLKLQLSKLQQKIDETQTKYLLNSDVDPLVYSKVMTELKESHAKIEESIERASIDTSTMITLLNELVPKLTNLPEIFEQFPLHQQQLFISVVFSRPLSYFDGIYRTPSIYPIFADKALILKEKGLLEIEQPINFLENSADCTPDGNAIQIEVLEGLRIAFAC